MKVSIITLFGILEKVRRHQRKVCHAQRKTSAIIMNLAITRFAMGK